VLDRPSVWRLVIARSCSSACRFRIRGESIPESERQDSAEASSSGACHLTEDPPGYDEKIKSQRKGERKQCQLGDKGHHTVQMAGVIAAFDNSVIGTRRDQ
jgi:hypothetical protein